MPPLTPPPASHIEKPLALWSRPFWPSDVGVRPNSPPQITSVSSSRPRPLQVGQQRRDRLVGLLGVVAVVEDVGVIVPRLAVAEIDLHHAHAALRQAAGHQAGVGELAVAVGRARLGRLLAQVEGVLGLELHAKGHLQARRCALPAGRRRRASSRCSSFICCNRSSCRRCVGARHVAVVDVLDELFRVRCWSC